MPRKPLRARRPARGGKPAAHDRQRAEPRAAGTPAAVSDQPSTSIIIPADLVDAIEKYNTTDWKDGRDPSKFGALNAAAYIGERTAAIVAAARITAPTEATAPTVWRGRLFVNGHDLGPAEMDPVAGTIEAGPHVAARARSEAKRAAGTPGAVSSQSSTPVVRISRGA